MTESEKSSITNPRRNFIQKSILGASTFAGLSVASTAHASVENGVEDFEPEIINEVDVLVVGSGSAGITSTASWPSRS